MGECRIGPYELDTVVQGDWVEVLRQLPDESVQCVVTSPPYWGLRDYGTASWEGGDEGCDHKRPLDLVSFKTTGLNVAKNPIAAQSNVGHRHEGYKFNCGKCGAVRIDAQLGLERTPDEYVAKIVEGFREVRRVLRGDGTCWVNLGDSYAGGGPIGRNDATPEALARRAEKYGTGQASGSRVGNHGSREKVESLKPKDLCGIPWRVAFALQSDGWWLRQDIIWSKPNPMPESVTDRCTKAHEYIFLLTKRERYYYDAEAVKEGRASDHDAGTFRGGCYVGGQIDNAAMGRRTDSGDQSALNGTRNKRSVWEITSKPFPEAHFATFPPEIPETCIKAGTSEQGCCAECGAPWQRVIEPDAERKAQLGKGWHGHDADLKHGQINGKPANGGYITVGWQPTCTCNAGEPVPCVVMDPFSGAGTVRMVAMKLGRHFIGAELNPEYIRLGYERTWAEDAQPSLFEPQPEQLQLS